VEELVEGEFEVGEPARELVGVLEFDDASASLNLGANR